MHCPRTTVLLASFCILLCSQGNSLQVCDEQLGCFTDDPPFSSPPGDEPLLPQGRNVVDVTYALFVRHQNQFRCVPNPVFQSVNVTGPHSQSCQMKVGRRWRQLLVASKSTKIVIHDHGDIMSNVWVFAMIENLLRLEDCQVIIVGWKAPLESYDQARANARFVGAEIALLLKNIQNSKSGFSFETVHLIGHGIGAHIASYVGERLKVIDPECLVRKEDTKQKNSFWKLFRWSEEEEECLHVAQLGRITGLNPAGSWYEDSNTRARLDQSDALFVDVIHTDVTEKTIPHFGKGLTQAAGHVDFYPNGGFDQPGCESEITGLERYQYNDSTGPLQPMKCNHARAIVYYLSSMEPSSCPMTSYPCKNWFDFIDGKCGSCYGEERKKSSIYQLFSYLGLSGNDEETQSCLRLGHSALAFWREHEAKAAEDDSTPQSIKAYMKTRENHPFCLHYVRLEIELNEPSSDGLLSVKFTDESDRSTGFIKVGRVSNWGTTSNPTYLISTPIRLRRISEVTILWELGVTTSWWPGHESATQAASRKETTLSLHNIKITQLPSEEIQEFCSPRSRLRSRRPTRHRLCGSDNLDIDYEE